MIVPVLLLIIGILMWHSVFSLQKSVGRNESKWYSSYGLIAALYIPFSPFILIKYAFDYYGLSNASTAYTGLIVSLSIFVMFINKTSKIHNDFKRESTKG